MASAAERKIAMKQYPNYVQQFVMLYPDQINTINIREFSERQARIDRPCCGGRLTELKAQVRHPLPFAGSPYNTTGPFPVKCCMKKAQQLSPQVFPFIVPGPRF